MADAKKLIEEMLAEIVDDMEGQPEPRIHDNDANPDYVAGFNYLKGKHDALKAILDQWPKTRTTKTTPNL